jgi:hypothetical protein
MPTTILPGNPLSQQNWRAGVTVEAERQCMLMLIEGEESDNGVVCEDFQENAGRGDILNLRFSQPNQTDLPGTSTQNIIGQESGTTYLSTTLQLRYLELNGAVVNMPAEQNQVAFSLQRNEVGRVARQWAETREHGGFYQLMGYNGVIPTGRPGAGLSINSLTDYTASLGNPVNPPDINKWFLVPAAGSAPGAQSATETAIANASSAVMSTRTIDEVVKRATSKDYCSWPMAPMDTPWGEKFVLAVGPQGFQQIKLNSSASDFYDLSRAAIQGSEGYDDNPLVNGQGFIYGDTVVLKTDFGTPGIVNASPSSPSGSGAVQANCKRAVLMGRRAGMCGYGLGYTGGDHFGFTELWLLRRWTFIVDTIVGFSRTQVNGESFGAFIISHYSDI